MNIAIILLAAGSSTRMGQSKQLLKVNGETLLVRSIKEALLVSTHVVVVLGANFEEHNLLIAHFPVTVVENTRWEKGMGSSLKAALNHILEKSTPVEAVLILMCDQPLLTSGHLKKLIHKSKETEKLIVASAYAKALGVPALFKKAVFAKLSALGDKDGAKKILKELRDSVFSVDFPGGEIDLDTKEDYEGFVGKQD